MKLPCEYCGKEIAEAICPFCGTEQSYARAGDVEDWRDCLGDLLGEVESSRTVPSAGRKTAAEKKKRSIEDMLSYEGICEMCGEEINSLVCPYCATEQSGNASSAIAPGIAVEAMAVEDIHDDMPDTATALKRAKAAIQKARSGGAQALKLIHGYGSSGVGGAIRTELRQHLRGMERRDELYGLIFGEEFHASYQECRGFLNFYPFLEKDEDFRRRNKGITIVLL